MQAGAYYAMIEGMKNSVLSLFLIVSVVVTGAFSLSVLGSHTHEGGHLCPVAAMAGESGCASTGGEHRDLASVFYHLSMIKNITQPTVEQSFSLLFILVFFLLAFSRSFLLDFVTAISSLSFSRQRHGVLKSKLFYSYRPFFQWLALQYGNYDDVRRVYGLV